MKKTPFIPSFAFLLAGLITACGGNSTTNLDTAVDGISKGIERTSGSQKTSAITNATIKEESNTISTNAGKGMATIAFYNVENLYDVENDSKVDDEDFTPQGKNKWDKKRYQDKLQKLAEVFSMLGDEDGAEIVGVCEIENKKVLEDLAAQSILSKHQYGVVHYDSPDKRGVDVGLFYKKDAFQVTDSKAHKVRLGGNRVSRDVLVVKGNLYGEEFYFIVNHFPSRREGEEESEPNRIAAANVTRKAIEDILKGNPTAKIVVMGDFNDMPDNNSIVDIIKANKNPQYQQKELFNAMYPLMEKGKGSYNFRGEWNMLDQMLLSEGVMKGKGFVFTKADIYAPNFIKETNPKYKGNPYRTYAGPNYLGGYSDHFPVFLQLKR